MEPKSEIWNCCSRKYQNSLDRRICPGCRFSKCEEVGMNPRAIRAEISSGGKILKDELIAKREPRSKIMLSVSIIVVFCISEWFSAEIERKWSEQIDFWFESDWESNRWTF